MKYGGYFDFESIRHKHDDLEKELNQPDFWNDISRAKKVSKELSYLKNELTKDKRTKILIDDLQTYLALLKEENTETLLDEAAFMLKAETEYIERVEIELLLNGKHDLNNAILTIHPGAGGTESQDWAEMLLRMYKFWADKSGYSFQIVDYLEGDGAGLKSVTVEICGDFVYGYLKGEAGIHRLVRISPFNAQGKRQTSFASIFVYPIIEDDIVLDISPADLKIDTFKSGGAGGQHVNTTDSAVRITHLPTNITVQCQNEKSQLQNKEKAMKVLKAKLYTLYEAEKDKEKQKLESTKTEIGWGNQIRSYVFHPYQMVKDHRTNFETGQIGNVMDGEISGFINAWLKHSV